MNALVCTEFSKLNARTDSVGHRVDDEVDPHTVGLTRKLFRIASVIHVFPSVSQIRIVGHDHHQPTSVVADSEYSRHRIRRRFPSLPAVAAVAHIWDLHDGVDIEKHMKDLVRHRHRLELTLWEDLCHLLGEILE